MQELFLDENIKKINSDKLKNIIANNYFIDIEIQSQN